MAARFLASMPLLVVVEMLDLPLSLVGMAEQRMLAQFSPESLGSSLLVHWARYLEGGARQLLPLGAAVCAIAAGDRWAYARHLGRLPLPASDRRKDGVSGSNDQGGAPSPRRRRAPTNR
jgi:hypothetical protein